jgi:hypothetical protein
MTRQNKQKQTNDKTKQTKTNKQMTRQNKQKQTNKQNISD